MWIALIVISLFAFPFASPSDVRLPPTITTSSQQSIIYSKYESIILECRAEGTPAVRYEWRKNGLESSTNLENIRKESNGTIIIDSATETDEGYYQCLAMNQYGTAVSDTIDVRMAFTELSGPETILQQTVVEGKPFHIQANRRRSFPASSVEWLKSNLDIKDPTFLSNTDRMQVAENGDLHFAYALSEDASGGNYYISLTRNSFLEELNHGSITNLTVTKNRGGNISEFAPTLAFSSATQTVALIGGNITLRCFFNGYPKPTIDWSGPTSTVRSGRFTEKSFNSERTIHSILPIDTGNYSCTGSNTKGNNTLTIQLGVGDVPKYQNAMDVPYNVNVTEGESITFRCKAKAKPEADIVWLHNGQPIDTDNPPKRFIFSSNKKSLTITDVCRDCVDRETKTDLMVIQCNASNVHGYAFAQGYLNVLLKTEVSISGPKTVAVDFLEEKEFVFHCDVTFDPSTPTTVRWYKTEPADHLVRNELPYVIVSMETLIIRVGSKCSDNCTQYLGEYRCVGDNGYTQDIQKIALTYQPPPADDTKKEASWAVWMSIVVAGAICLVLLLIGTTCLFLRLKRIPAVDRRTNNRRLPNLPSIYEDVEYDPIGLPLEELAENKEEESMRGVHSMYEHLAYDCTAHREETTNVSDAYGCNKYETIDAPERETVDRRRPMLNEGMTGDDIGYLTPLDEITFYGKIDQQKVDVCNAGTGEPETFPKSNDVSVSINAYVDLNREEASHNTAVEKSISDPKEGISHMDTVSGEENKCLGQDHREVNPYLDLVSKEVNPYLDLVSQEGNPYLNLVSNEMTQNIDLGLKEVNQYTNLAPKKVNEYLDLSLNEVNQCVKFGPNEVNQCMKSNSKEENQYMNVGTVDMDPILNLISKEVNQDLQLGTREAEL